MGAVNKLLSHREEARLAYEVLTRTESYVGTGITADVTHGLRFRKTLEGSHTETRRIRTRTSGGITAKYKLLDLQDAVTIQIRKVVVPIHMQLECSVLQGYGWVIGLGLSRSQWCSVGRVAVGCGNESRGGLRHDHEGVTDRWRHWEASLFHDALP